MWFLEKLRKKYIRVRTKSPYNKTFITDRNEKNTHTNE